MCFKSTLKKQYFEFYKKSKKSFHFLVGDIEASLNDDNEFEFVLGIFFDGVVFHICTDIEDYFYHIKKYFEDNQIPNKQRKIYFHNLNFDILFFLKKIEFGEDINIINSGNMMLQLQNKDFIFVNSLSLLPMSLKKVVTNWLKIDFKEWEQQKNEVLDLEFSVLTNYCKRDCFLLYFGIFKLLEVVEENFQISNFLTIPSLAMKVFKKHFNDYKFLENKSNSFFNDGYYFGGHTEKFVSGVYKFSDMKLNYYDVNSLYPFVMKDLEISQSPFKMVKSDLKTIFSLYYKKFHFWIDCLIEIKHDNFRVIPIKYKESNYYPKGVFRCKFSHLTFDFLLKNKHLFIKEIYGVITTEDNKTEKVFKKYVEYNYEKRKRETANDIVFKLILNSLYGKFGQKREQQRMVLNPQDFTIYESVKQIGNDNFICTKNETSNYNIDYLRKDVAGLITEKARLYMGLQRLKLYNKGIKVYYQDTDSFMINEDLQDYYSLKKLEDSKTLGLFKKENSKPVKDFYLIGLKLYYLNEELQAKKGLKNLSKNDFHRIYLALKIIEDSKKKYLRFFKKDEPFKIDLFNYPNLKFYNSRFTQPKTFFNKGFFGIQIVPFHITKISEKLDVLPINYNIDNKFLLKKPKPSQ